MEKTDPVLFLQEKEVNTSNGELDANLACDEQLLGNREKRNGKEKKNDEEMEEEDERNKEMENNGNVIVEMKEKINVKLEGKEGQEEGEKSLENELEANDPRKNDYYSQQPLQQHSLTHLTGTSAVSHIPAMIKRHHSSQNNEDASNMSGHHGPNSTQDTLQQPQQIPLLSTSKPMEMEKSSHEVLTSANERKKKNTSRAISDRNNNNSNSNHGIYANMNYYSTPPTIVASPTSSMMNMMMLPNNGQGLIQQQQYGMNIIGQYQSMGGKNIEYYGKGGRLLSGLRGIPLSAAQFPDVPVPEAVTESTASSSSSVPSSQEDENENESNHIHNDEIGKEEENLSKSELRNRLQRRQNQILLAPNGVDIAYRQPKRKSKIYEEHGDNTAKNFFHPLTEEEMQESLLLNKYSGYTEVVSDTSNLGVDQKLDDLPFFPDNRGKKLRLEKSWRRKRPQLGVYGAYSKEFKQCLINTESSSMNGPSSVLISSPYDLLNYRNLFISPSNLSEAADYPPYSKILNSTHLEELSSDGMQLIESENQLRKLLNRIQRLFADDSMKTDHSLLSLHEVAPVFDRLLHDNLNCIGDMLARLQSIRHHIQHTLRQRQKLYTLLRQYSKEPEPISP